VKNSPIASISWGFPRTFKLTPKNTSDASMTLKLGDGDLVIMGGKCQQTHKHEILKIKKGDLSTAGNRINFTFRCFNV
jgi:alkylated DNA repair dioxygenase AlkB